jgi:hypothetical protein
MTYHKEGFDIEFEDEKGESLFEGKNVTLPFRPQVNDIIFIGKEAIVVLAVKYCAGKNTSCCGEPLIEFPSFLLVVEPFDESS